VGTQGRVGRTTGQELTYISRKNIVHVDDLVEQIRSYDDIGVDMVMVNLPSYRHGEFNNMEMQLNQVELLAEHVLPKIPSG
jgi:murein L,D-transpeptidase YcbB/YkuD